MSVNLELLWPCKYIFGQEETVIMVLYWVAYLLDEHFSGTGGDSSFGCFLFLLFL